MKKKIKWILIILFIISSIMLLVNRATADWNANTNNNPVHEIIDLVQWNYNDFNTTDIELAKNLSFWIEVPGSGDKHSAVLKNLTFDIDNQSPSYEYRVRTGNWGINATCVESVADGKFDKNYISTVLDIKSDGKCKAIYYDGTSNWGINEFEGGDIARKIAFVASEAIKLRDTYKDKWLNYNDYYNAVYKDKIYYYPNGKEKERVNEYFADKDVRGATRYLWINSDFKETLKSKTGLNYAGYVPPGKEGTKENFDNLLKRYYNLTNNTGTDIPPCVAKMVIFNCKGQSKIFLYGKEEETKFSIKKYITKVENIKQDDEVKNDIISVDNRADKSEGDKKTEPVKIYYGGARITYRIEITNEGNRAITGTFNDTYNVDNDTFFTNFKYVEGGTNPSKTLTIPAHQTKAFDITLDGTTGIFGAKHENKASFTVKNKVKYSSDYVKVEEKKPPIINKYITQINDTEFERYKMSENDKASYPENGGLNTEDKRISYKIEIKNENSFEITGTFTDEIDSELTIISMSLKNGESITIPANSTETIDVVATIPKGCNANIYGNTAKFVYEKFEVESSDYFEINEKVNEEAYINKYIKSVENSEGSFKDGRKDMSIVDRMKYPAEVEKGSKITYRIEIENKIHYQNTSASCHGKRCEEHLKKHDLDWLKCKENFDSSQLKYVSIKGGNDVNNIAENETNVTFEDSNYIMWKNVPEGNTVWADITFEVVSSNMKLENVENKVDDMQYEYSRYRCIVAHGEYYSIPCIVHGAHSKCTHKKCSLIHNYSIISGKISGSSMDYARLLDPIVEGFVFIDKNNNNLKDGDGENISQMENDKYKSVVVELWKSDKVDEFIADRTVDPITGKFSFGRVRKGPSRIVSEGNVNNYVDIGEDNYFYYTDEKLYHYYLVYYYNGERYEAVVNSGMNNLNPSDHYIIKNNNYKIDSNAEEIDRTGFNYSLETISYNKAYNGKDNLPFSKDLSYDIKNSENNLQQSELKWRNSSIAMTAKSFSFYYNSGADGDDTEYLRYINLGLFERNKADISLKKDVVKAEVTINNHQTTYNYESLGIEPYVSDDSNVLKKPYQLAIYREDYEYRTSKYDGTIQSVLNENNQYKSYGRDNDLNIILTYKITVTNNSESSSARIKEIIDYSSKELELLTETVNMDTIGGPALIVDTNTLYSNPIHNDTIYNQHFFTGDALTNKIIKAGESFNIYLSYKVLKDNEGYIKEDSINDDISESKMNIVEIGAYSFYSNDEATIPAGLIDINSNPGNIEFDSNGKVKTRDEQGKILFEDDTFETGILIVLKDDVDDGPPPITKECYRNISGIVFEKRKDNAKEIVDGQKIGNDTMELDDRTAGGVLVKLYEVIQKKDANGNSIKDYYVDTGLWYRTRYDGKYYFGDKTQNFANDKPENDSSDIESTDDCYKIHAGNYVVRFIYGDEPNGLGHMDGNTIFYSGQDFKSVKYKEVGTKGKEDEIVKASVFANIAGNSTEFTSSGEPNIGGTIYSVAKDNEIRRLEVNRYSITTTYPMDTILKAKNSNEVNLLVEHTSMFADTKTFDLDIEYYDNYDDKVSYIKELPDGTIEEKDYYSVRNINFGLIERPTVKLQLMNDIKEITAITSDGNTLIDIIYDIKYKMNTNTNTVERERTYTGVGKNNIQSLDRDGSNAGFRYVNVDTDLLQGMTVIIKYQTAIANISEIDHLSKWLEDKIEKEPEVDLDISYGESNIGVLYKANDSIIIDCIDNQSRKYDYSKNYLYKILYLGDSSIGLSALRNADDGTIHTYGDITDIGSENVKKAYSYTNIVQNVKSDYKPGYFLGNIYYNGALDSNIEEARVRTRVDQYVNYVDNDLVFKTDENLNDKKEMTYLTYETSEIAKRGLLKGITPKTISISDGTKDYYNINNPNKNNLAFNVENYDINNKFYKFLEPIYRNREIDENDLYVIDFKASKTLSSEMDAEGLEIENLAEIVKVTNTVGRKVYVKIKNYLTDYYLTGYIGNTTEYIPIENITAYVPNMPGESHPTQNSNKISLVEISRQELDTDFAEYITFSPPTGLTGQDKVIKDITEKTGGVLLIIIPVIIIIGGTVYVIVQFIKRKKFYK